ncbi:MAG: uncharacterized protein H6Q58_2162 [Firmicutes bacterium]|nr:uncharacterized protein [Bacillota bacterium]
MSKTKKVLVFLAIILVIAVAGFSISLKAIEKNLNELANTRIVDVDISKSIDGVYTGSYEQFPVSAEVKVTIENQKITEIELIKHVTGKGAAAEAITGKVIETQSLDVDSISGATYSSKVILKAIQNALEKSNQ